MKELLIIGARGFGREVFNLAKESKGYLSEFRVKGFLDDKYDALNNFVDYPPIISSVEQYEISSDDIFICALGDVNYKYYYSNIILQKGGIFTSIIHPSAFISQNTKIGKGCIISRYVTISCDVAIGDFVTISTHAGVGHDVQIGSWCHIGGYSNLSGGVQIEDKVTLHPGSNVVPHKIIHTSAVVGAGSVVLNNVKAGTTVFGVPAKRINLN